MCKTTASRLVDELYQLVKFNRILTRLLPACQLVKVPVSCPYQTSILENFDAIAKLKSWVNLADQKLL